MINILSNVNRRIPTLFKIHRSIIINNFQTPKNNYHFNCLSKIKNPQLLNKTNQLIAIDKFKIHTGNEYTNPSFFSTQEKIIFGLSVLIIASGALIYICRLERDPLSGTYQFVWDNDKRIDGKGGELIYEKVLERYNDIILPASHSSYDKVMKILNNLIEENKQHSALKNYDWKLHIIESDEGGAFFIPGGKIFIATGLLKIADNDLKIKFILAHQMAHMAMKHKNCKKTQTMYLRLLSNF